MGHLWEIFQEVGKHGGIMAVHAEEDDIVTYMEEKLEREGRDHGSNLHLAHNNISEDISFRKVVRLAQKTETGIYFVHTTAKEGVAAIAEARAAQLPVYGEALHNYLEFTCDDYLKPDGLAIHTYPAIKFSDDRDALQQGLVDGPICTTATDEWTTYKNIKLAGDTIRTLCGGHNGIETRMPVTYTKLAATDAIDLERFAAITSTNAAKILGMYPQKGAIAVGSDADIVLFDPNLKKTITVDELHADSDYSIWDGFECEGYPIMTILRGQGQCPRRATAGQLRRRPLALPQGRAARNHADVGVGTGSTGTSSVASLSSRGALRRGDLVTRRMASPTTRLPRSARNDSSRETGYA